MTLIIKRIALLFFLLVAAAVVPAQTSDPEKAQDPNETKKTALKMSGGAGVVFTDQFTNWFFFNSPGLSNDYLDSMMIGFGLFAFFDATYIELDTGIVFGGWNYFNDTRRNQVGISGEFALTYIRFGALGKYPFKLGKLEIFPLLGIEVDVCVGGKYKNAVISDATESFTKLWFKTGVGVDIPLTSILYLRPEFLYGIGLQDKLEKVIRENNESILSGNNFNHGFDIKLAIGVRL
ncbi:hypothetical protein FACS189494_10380 [Spirochaetia bacterium]|nr:hypothetical protein FACS189494_10380 [Spirochaetia bacterium]